MVGPVTYRNRVTYVRTGERRGPKRANRSVVSRMADSRKDVKGFENGAKYDPKQLRRVELFTRQLLEEARVLRHLAGGSAEGPTQDFVDVVVAMRAAFEQTKKKLEGGLR